LKIGIFAPADLSASKAASIRINNIIHILNKNNYQIFVYCFKKPKNLEEGVLYRQATKKMEKKDLYSSKRIFFDLILLTKMIGDLGKIDIIHCNHLDGGFFCSMLKIISFFRVSLILDMHGPFIPELKHYAMVRNNLLLKIMELIEKMTYNLSDHIFVTSEGLKKIISEKVKEKEKVSVLYDYVNLDIFDSSIESKILKSYNLDSKKIIMYAGRLKEYQGVDYLIRAFALVLKDNPNAHLVIVGNSNIPKYKEIARKAGILKNVTFTGLKSHSLVPQYLSGADILVAPRISTEVTKGGFISQLPEYLAMNKAVVSADVSDSSKILEEGKYGLLVEDKNPNELAKAINKLLEDTELRKKLAEGSRKRAYEFSWQKNFSKIEDTYHSIINEK